MLGKLMRQLRGREVRGRDGRAGELDDLIIDALRWEVRHLVVDTGNWLRGPRVLVPPAAAAFGRDAVTVALTRAQVRASPPAANAPTAAELAAQAREAREGRRGFWEGHARLRDSAARYGAPFGGEPALEDDAIRALVAGYAARRTVLVSGGDLLGCRVDTARGRCGRVRDLFFAPRSWAVTAMLVRPRGIFGAACVTLPPESIEYIDWEESAVRVALTREEFGRVPAAQ